MKTGELDQDLCVSQAGADQKALQAQLAAARVEGDELRGELKKAVEEQDSVARRSPDAKRGGRARRRA